MVGYGYLEIDYKIIDADGRVSSKFIKELKSMKELNLDHACELIESLDSYIDQYKRLAIEISENDYFRSCLKAVNSDIAESLKEMKSEMVKRHPTSYAQGLMGKSFWNISDWKEHEFIPVYFNSPMTVRLFDDNRNIMIRSLFKREESGEALKKNR